MSESDELATITFGEPLHLGHGKLHITYNGILNDKLKGFYRSKYTHPSGEVRYSAATQFEVNIILIYRKIPYLSGRSNNKKKFFFLDI